MPCMIPGSLSAVDLLLMIRLCYTAQLSLRKGDYSGGTNNPVRTVKVERFLQLVAEEFRKTQLKGGF